MRSKLLVIGGYATSGKDAVANFLVSELGWYKTYMSKPLETALLTLDPYIPIRIESGIFVLYSALHATVGYDESKKNPEVRRLLQTLGTEVGRNLMGNDVWLDAVCREVTGKLADGQNVVVTGVRYPNEMARFKDFEAQTLWISRPGVEPVNSHSSDNTLDHQFFDIWCNNAGSLEDLKLWTIDRFKD